MVEIIIIFSVLFLAAWVYITVNLYKKLKKLENDYIVSLKIINDVVDLIDFADRRLSEVDLKKSFESDDEIGFYFKSIKTIQKILNDFANLIKKETINEEK